MKVAYAVVFENCRFDGFGIEKVVKQDTGSYLVYYKEYFDGSPGVSATPWPGGTLCSVSIDAENTCAVFVTDLQGKPVDNGFFFLAVGK